MSTDAAKVSPAQRLAELAANDPQLQQLMPDEAVLADVTRKDQSLAGIVCAILAGYGPRPALGERVYEVAGDDSGRQVRRWLPEFHTITYASSSAGYGRWRRCGSTTRAAASSRVRPSPSSGSRAPTT